MKLREIFSRLEEGLTKDQKRGLYSELKNLNYDRHRWAGVFGNRYRIYLDYSGEIPEYVKDTLTYDEVVSALNSIGMKYGNSGWNVSKSGYLNGQAFRRVWKKVPVEVALGNDNDIITKWREDISNNTEEYKDKVINKLDHTGCILPVRNSHESYMSGNFLRSSDEVGSIGKILLQGINANLINASVLQNFVNDPNRGSAAKQEYKQKLMVVISRHPDDIGSMSTGRRWNNCMNIDSGGSKKFIPIDIAEGSVIAYLIRANDLKIEDPLARIMIKPFINESNGKVALGVQDIVYPPEAPKEFSKIVVDWANSVNSSLKLNGLFKLSSKVYNDRKGDSQIRAIGNVNDDSILYMRDATLNYLLNEIANSIDDTFVYEKLRRLEQDEDFDWLVDIGYAHYDEDGEIVIDRDRIKKDNIRWVDYNKEASKWRNLILSSIRNLGPDIKRFVEVNERSEGEISTEELPEIVADQLSIPTYDMPPHYKSASYGLESYIRKNIELVKIHGSWHVN